MSSLPKDGALVAEDAANALAAPEHIAVGLGVPTGRTIILASPRDLFGSKTAP